MVPLLLVHLASSDIFSYVDLGSDDAPFFRCTIFLSPRKLISEYSDSPPFACSPVWSLIMSTPILP